MNSLVWRPEILSDVVQVPFRIVDDGDPDLLELPIEDVPPVIRALHPAVEQRLNQIQLVEVADILAAVFPVVLDVVEAVLDALAVQLVPAVADPADPVLGRVQPADRLWVVFASSAG